MSQKNIFGQTLVALVTPMTADGEVDWADTEKLIDYVISNGADGVVVTGTTGETSTLTDAEKIKLVEVGKSVSAGRAKIITGGGSNETAHAMQLYKASEKAGADGQDDTHNDEQPVRHATPPSLVRSRDPKLWLPSTSSA